LGRGEARRGCLAWRNKAAQSRGYRARVAQPGGRQNGVQPYQGEAPGKGNTWRRVGFGKFGQGHARSSLRRPTGTAERRIRGAFFWKVLANARELHSDAALGCVARGKAARRQFLRHQFVKAFRVATRCQRHISPCGARAAGRAFYERRWQHCGDGPITARKRSCSIYKVIGRGHASLESQHHVHLAYDLGPPQKFVSMHQAGPITRLAARGIDRLYRRAKALRGHNAPLKRTSCRR